jgi:hypothetical protein
MKINDLYVQQDQLDEVSLGGIGRGIAKGVGAVSRGVGAVAGGVAGAVDAAAQGFAGGRAAVSGQTPTTNATAPATTATNTTSNASATSAPAGNAPTTNATAPAGNAPATNATAPAKGTADFGTIQRSIKTLSPKQKTALATQLAGKAPATNATAPAATPAATAPVTNEPAPAATAPTGPQKGQEVALASGEKYQFAGQQWVEIDPSTGAELGGAALPAGFQKSLTGIAAKQQASSTTDAGTPNLRVVDGGKAAVAEGFYYRSKFLNIIL